MIAYAVEAANPLPWQFAVPILISCGLTVFWFMSRFAKRPEDREN